MKKGNSVTRKVQRRRRRMGGHVHKPIKPENLIKTLPGTQRHRTQRPPPTPTPTDLRVNGPGNVDDTLVLLTGLYGRTPQRRNGGRTYKNKYKTKTPIKPKPKPKLP